MRWEGVELGESSLKQAVGAVGSGSTHMAISPAVNAYDENGLGAQRAKSKIPTAAGTCVDVGLGAGFECACRTRFPDKGSHSCSWLGVFWARVGYVTIPSGAFELVLHAGNVKVVEADFL